MNNITILCCYNDLKQYKIFLKSLSKQSIGVEMIGIDNTQNLFQSAASAFNEYLKRIDTKYVIFTHQDIEFSTINALEVFKHYLQRIGIYDILGVAGKSGKHGKVITNIMHGYQKSYAGANRLLDIEECDTVDECFFGGYTECFKKYPFDDKLCNNWHLYAVERCLATINRKNKVFVCDIPLFHKSRGKMNHIYNKQFYFISKKYSNSIKYLNTTCASASTEFPFREISFIKRLVCLIIHRY